MDSVAVSVAVLNGFGDPMIDIGVGVGLNYTCLLICRPAQPTIYSNSVKIWNIQNTWDIEKVKA